MTSKQKESDKLMKLMTKKSLKARPLKTMPLKAKRPTVRAKPMVLLLDSLKQSSSQSLVYLAPDLITSQAGRMDKYRAAKPHQPLWSFQEEAVAFGKSREMDSDGLGTRSFMLCDEMGLGKTMSILSLVLEQNQAKARVTGKRFNGTTLIVATKEELIDQTWLRDLENFPEQTFFYHILTTERDSLLDFSEAERKNVLENCCDLVFTTYSTVKNVFAKAGRNRLLFDILWRRVAADEAHIMVNQETDVFIAMNALNAEVKIVITGTPKQNHDSDVVNLSRFCGLFLEEGSEFPLEKIMLRREEWEVRHLIVLPNSLKEKREPVLRKIEYIDFKTNPEKLLYYTYAKLAQERGKGLNVTYLISVMREICICPAVINNLVLPDCLLPMGQKPFVEEKPHTKELRKIIDKFFQSDLFKVSYRDGPSYLTCGGSAAGEFVFDKSPLGKDGERVWKELSTREDWSEPIPFLREKDSPQAYREVLNVLDRVIRFDRPMSKERVLLESISKTPREDKIIVFVDMIEPLYRIAKFLHEDGFESIISTGEIKNRNTDRIEKFRTDPSIKVLLMTLKYGNEGFNIPEANWIFFFGPWWNPSPMKQGEFRVQRPGQEKQVHITYLIMNNTIESYIMNLSEKKNAIKTSLSITDLKKRSSPLFDYSVTFGGIRSD